MTIERLAEDCAAISPGWLAFAASGGKWKYPAHLARIDRELLRCANARLEKLIVNMPPRHGKSELISKWFPAWFLCLNPDKRVLLASYEAQFAAGWGAKVRDLIDEFGSRFGVAISRSARAADNFRLAGAAGGMSCAGAGGALTGKGADLLIIDDPVKNDAEANSSHYRDSVWDWFRATALTRLEPGGSLALVMTRWHEDDLAGRLLESTSAIGDNSFCHISMPALSESGDALWSERYPKEKLLDIKREIGEYWFSALYMQSPSPAGGGIFKRANFQYFDIANGAYIFSKSGERHYYPADALPKYCAVDLAVSSGERSDFTVAVVAAISPKNEIFLVDVLRRRFDGADHLDFLKRIADLHNPALIGVEAVQYQLSLVQSALREGLPVKALKPVRDKVSRALPMAAKLECGDVYFRREASWLGDFERETLAFPNAANDDQVDAFAYLAEMIRFKSGGAPASSRKGRKTPFDKF